MGCVASANGSVEAGGTTEPQTLGQDRVHPLGRSAYGEMQGVFFCLHESTAPLITYKFRQVKPYSYKPWDEIRENDKNEEM